MNPFNIVEEIVLAIKVVIAISIVSILVNVIFISDWSWGDIGSWMFYNAYLGFPFAFANSYFNTLLDRKFDWESQAKNRLIVGISSSIVMNVLLMMILMMFNFAVIKGGRISDAFSPQLKGTYFIAIIIVIMITLVFYSIAFYKWGRDEKKKNKQLKQEKTIAELNALKSQIDPHFLFNSFNVLSGLIDEDQGKAQKFLGGLSKIYRYVLEQRDADLTTISEELEFAKQFVNLQKARFEDGVQLEVDVSEQLLSKKIPALSLQLLLENAIKHNGFDDANPLNINIEGNDNRLKISNNKQIRHKLVEGNGIGLTNIKKRYDLHKAEGFEVIDHADSFTVLLPLL